MRQRVRWMAVPAGAAMLFMLAALVVSAQPAPPGDHIAFELNHPRGMSIDGDDILVAEVAEGRILRIASDGTMTTAVEGLPSGVFFFEELGADEAAGPSAVIAVEGGYVVTISEAPESEFQSLYFVDEDGNIELLADLGAYEAEHNTDGGTLPTGEPELLSNPYDVLPDGEGGYFVSDAGANAVLRVAADGTITPYGIFFDRESPLFPEFGPPMMDQVPTGMAIGPDGALYVATLTGFPFPQGEARVYRLEDLNGDGDALDEGEMTVYATGLTALTDIAFDANGNLLAIQFSSNMLAEAPGQLVRVGAHGVEVLVDGLITPTGLVVTPAGRVVVTQEFAGLVSDVTDLFGAGFSEMAPAGGVALTQFEGTQAQFELASGLQTCAITVDGAFQTYVFGAPTFVNASFLGNADFSSQLLVCRGG